ncbi:DUF3426 domain-containing protein [Ramlibacter sp. PS3R-8]|uniref:DUF3426 domain-containing protein n=1 Tax=Ramlibacter sp. PS3R-8 TaxID=3133437 RepID=UPI00309508F3
MSLITSCPACGTMFRVVPDQLKISEGWVRCGHCSNVFDAQAHLVDENVLARQAAVQASWPVDLQARPADVEPRGGFEAETVPASMETVPAPMETRPASLDTRPASLDTVPADLLRRPSAGPRAPAVTTARSGAEDGAAGEDSSFFGSDSQSLEQSPLDTPFVFNRSDLVPPGDASVFPPPPADSELPRDDDGLDEELDDVSFVRNGRRNAFWRRPFVRLMLALLALLLGGALLLQVAHHDRDRLAQAQPELRPALQLMCEWLECALGAPRQIEAIAIESSGFNRVRNDTYRLAFTLRNTGRVQVATPAIELTVTDSQDQPIARRVLLPAELGADGKVIPAASDWSAAAGVVLAVPGGARVAGYRLLAFYP